MGGPHWLCRLWRHKWEIWHLNLAGHASYRERRCRRCLDHGFLITQRQQRGYYGGPLKGEDWITQSKERLT